MMDGFEIYAPLQGGGERFLGKAVVYVADRPGVLAELASLFALHGVNITVFHYNRSEHPGRVILECRALSADDISAVFEDLTGRGIHDPALATPRLELNLTDTSGILNIEVELAHTPGTLGRFASLLGDEGANVIHMSYNEDVSEGSARFAIATADGMEVDSLLGEMNAAGWHYSLLYKGVHSGSMEEVIGLNLVERFFFRLKRTLGDGDVERVKELAMSSKGISDALAGFSREAGRDLEAGSVFTGMLAFTSASVLRTGDNFSYHHLPPLVRGALTLHVFRLPSGGNVIVLESADGLTMVDGGYGLYHEDTRRMLKGAGLPMEKISRIYLSHADSDHCGMSGYIQQEFSPDVFMHAGCQRVIEEGNRAAGSATAYMQLNRLFTGVVDGFTRAAYPEGASLYGSRGDRTLGGFPVLDSFEAGGHEFMVLESLGGHVHGQVFFVSPSAGLALTSDYMLDVGSLGEEEKKVLSVPRFMMVSTNVDSALFRREMDMLGELLGGLAADSPDGMTVIPGHGDYYEIPSTG